ncbi:UbiA family prenyltransferase [Streptomyces sp. NBC_01017]|uniref:UbiA family prenyltransferase n=1 Tax=Streptomyces sp. NBC_01017 TaxID=2903721 RepID=UPI00386D6D0E|nr:UbiA family prenyltransferase [Streptomyces sp. NBC_01017]WSV35093.1 UbiA family prenyltransferase [Streptomyces sp. NBC_01017]
MATSTFIAAGLPARELPVVLLKILTYGFLYIYAFTTVNQLASGEEDAANKPHRPLAKGIVTRQWMIRRAVATNALFITIGFLFSIPWPTLTWLALIHLHNIFDRIYRHWFFKNVVFISLGAGVELTAVWGLTAPTALPWAWICVTSLLAGIGCNCQDIRDVVGDRLVRRKTMSVAWGERNARAAAVLILFSTPVIQYAVLPWPPPSAALLICLGIPCALIWLSATRFLLFRNPRSDHWSYQLFCFWWCSALLLQPLVITGYIG